LPQHRRLEVRLVILGDAGVGKTSLLRWYVFNDLNDDRLGPLGELTCDMEVEGPSGEMVLARVVLLEYNGGRFPEEAVEEPLFRGKQGFIFVADLTQRASVKYLASWIPAVASVAGDVPMRIILAKSDEGASDLGLFQRWLRVHAPNIPYAVASAHTGEGVSEAIDALILEAVARDRAPKPLEVSEIGLKVLDYVGRRGSLGATTKELMRAIQGVDFHALTSEVDELVRLGLATRDDFGPASFRLTVTDKGCEVLQYTMA
jgi:hypothetical protein